MLLYTARASPKSVNKEVEKLDKLASESSKVIFELKSTFPFQFFPDNVIIDENKVTIVRNDLLFRRIIPIDYSDILTIKISKTIIFSSMEFEIKRSRFGPISITYLNSKKATLAKEYIMGMLIAKKANVDFSNLSLSEIRNRVREIGYGREDNDSLLG